MTNSKQFRKQVRQLANQYGLREGFRAYGNNLKTNRFRLKMMFYTPGDVTTNAFKENLKALVNKTNGVELKFGQQGDKTYRGLTKMFDMNGLVVNLYFDGRE